MMLFARAGLSAILLAAAGGAAFAQSPSALRAEQVAVFATVRQFIAAFNAGDARRTVATCASQASIVDEFPPHQWNGPGACAQWFRDLAAFNKSQGIGGALVRLGAPAHVDVEGS
ncbi:MAG: nuclear transport factor 2 family protein, partial [Candidatus Eremiobacteraeota bacterium]|nr:nuclear transport factor 2 family protein [Candidatus Eremiobacteraeota bacterium]